MADQPGQQPTPYPQPAPGGPPPPPPGMFPPTATMTPPPEPPKKKRTGLIIAIVAVVLGLCVLVSCGVGAAVMMSGKGDKDTIASAEGHLDKAIATAETILSKTKNSSGDSATLAADLADGQKKLRAGRDEIAAATATAERLKDSQGKTDYLNSLKSVNSEFDSLQEVLTYLSTLTAMSQKAEEANKLASSASDEVNDAITAGNLHNFSGMKKKAVSARSKFAKAATIYREANSMAPAAGLGKLATYCDKRKQEADVVVRMAAEGKAGKSSAYNADIKKQQALFQQAVRARGSGSMDLKSMQSQLGVFLTKAQTDATQADTLREKALKELGYTTQ